MRKYLSRAHVAIIALAVLGLGACTNTPSPAPFSPSSSVSHRFGSSAPTGLPACTGSPIDPCYIQDGSPVYAHTFNNFPKSADTVAQLRGYIGATGESIDLRGASSAGDGNGGTFYWSAVSVASDDGLTVIQPTAESGAGRWLRLQIPLTSLSGLLGGSCGAHQWMTALSSGAVPSCAQPTASDISGLGTAAVKNTGGTVCDPGTGTLEFCLPSAGTATLTANNKNFAVSDTGKYWDMTNGGVAMTASLPAGSGSSKSIAIFNTDASAGVTFTVTGGGWIGVSGNTSWVISAGKRAYLIPDGAGNWLWLANDNALAPLASPVLTGTPTAPTPTTSDNSTKIATTAYVQAQVVQPIALPNALRNSALVDWQMGASGTITTTPGITNWTADGIYCIPTGANVTWSQTAPSNVSASQAYNGLQITGAASNTDVKCRFVIASRDAAPLRNQQVTFQIRILNSTGATLTPLVSSKYPSAQDNWGTSSTDLAATNLSSVASAASALLAYTFPVAGLAKNGYEIVVDFGALTAGMSVEIAGGFDLHASPGLATGIPALVPQPFIESIAATFARDTVFYYDAANGGSTTAWGFTNYGIASTATIIGIVPFPAMMWERPSVTFRNVAYTNGSAITAATTFGTNNASQSIGVTPTATGQYACTFNAIFDARISGG